MANNPQEYNCRGAIALSNKGVTLLERFCTIEGFNTLKGAVMAVRLAFFPEDLGFDVFEAYVRINDQVQHAERCLCLQQKEQHGKAVDSAGRCQVSVVLSDGMLVSTSPGVMSPIYIEPTDFESFCNRDPHLSSAIVMYNFGIAHFLVSGLAPFKDSVAKLKAGAIKLLTLADSILQSHGDYANIHEHQDTLETLKYLHVSIHVLASLCKLLPRDEAAMYGHRLSFYRSQLEEYDYTVPVMKDKKVAPAA